VAEQPLDLDQEHSGVSGVIVTTEGQITLSRIERCRARQSTGALRRRDGAYTVRLTRAFRACNSDSGWRVACGRDSG